MPTDGVPARRSGPFDEIVGGGSYAGLSDALGLVRARKRTLIAESGPSRNDLESSAHDLPGQDGRAPKAIVRSGLPRSPPTRLRSSSTALASPQSQKALASSSR